MGKGALQTEALPELPVTLVAPIFLNYQKAGLCCRIAVAHLIVSFPVSAGRFYC